jgi:hypothetical protein
MKGPGGYWRWHIRAAVMPASTHLCLGLFTAADLLACNPVPMLRPLGSRLVWFHSAWCDTSLASMILQDKGSWKV